MAASANRPIAGAELLRCNAKVIRRRSIQAFNLLAVHCQPYHRIAKSNLPARR